VIKDDQKASKALQRQADDFKLIRGIKAGVENRLHTAGIRTYDQLASLTPNEILLKLGKASGYTVNRISKEDWIGQARMLSSKQAQRKSSKKEASSLAKRQHYENFTVEFLLDESNRVRRARILHVQSGDADTWSGWEASQFIDFIARHSSVRLPVTRPVPPKSVPASSMNEARSPSKIEEGPVNPAKGSPSNRGALPSYPMSETTPAPTAFGNNLSIVAASSQPQVLATPNSINTSGSIQFLECKVFLGNEEQPLRRSLPRDQTFDICLIFSLQNILGAKRPLLMHSMAILYAKKLAGDRQIIGRLKDIQLIENKITLSFNNVTLPPGMYRLEALININYEAAGITDPQNIETHWESHPLQIY
jgi:hypothetical protein